MRSAFFATSGNRTINGMIYFQRMYVNLDVSPSRYRLQLQSKNPKPCQSRVPHKLRHWVDTVRETVPVFVSNRIKEIRLLRDTEFHHVGTNDNPADLATRGKPAEDLASSKLWWCGPQWFPRPVSEWPTKSVVDPICQDELQDIELRCGQHTLTTLLAIPQEPKTSEWRPCDTDPISYSSFWRLVRITVVCLKFLSGRIWSHLDNAAARLPTLELLFSRISEGNNITSDDMRLATRMWVKAAQHNQFRKVLDAINNNAKHCLVKQLNLFMDASGLLRCGGRMIHADLAQESINPALLPKNDHIYIFQLC